MKKLLAAMFVALLMVVCVESSTPNVPTVPPNSDLDQLLARIAIDLDNKETLEKIIAQARDGKNLQKRGEKELWYFPDEQTPYTGWVKDMHKNGRIEGLVQVKAGKMSGLINVWYENGQKKAEGTFKDGKMDGLLKGWYENGQKKTEGNWKDGKFMSAEAWKPNGENCPVTNLKDGNGVAVMYEDDGTEGGRTTYKDGKVVFD